MLLFISADPAVGQTLISKGSVWKYLDDGSDQGTDWKETRFNDSAWKSGSANLKSGTIDALTNSTTTYFRSTFDYTPSGDETRLIFKTMVGAGAIIYINGKEVLRINMPSDAVNFNSYAVSGGNEKIYQFNMVPIEDVGLSGTNVIAVELRNGSAGITENIWDLELLTSTYAIGNISHIRFGSTGDPLNGLTMAWNGLELVFDSETQFVGMIFRDVKIPAGATITNAYVQFTVDAVVAGVTDAAITLEVYGAAEANVTGPFTENLFSVSSHPGTTAKVTWEPGPSVAVGDAGENEQTPDISAIVTEIVTMDGWAPGNNIMIVVTGDPAQTKNINREFESYNGDPMGAPVLNVTFRDGGTSSVNEINAGFSSKVYPNPTLGILYIENPSKDDFSFEIYSISGKLVSSRHNITGPTTKVDMSGLSKGIYIVHLRSAERSVKHKVILQ